MSTTNTIIYHNALKINGMSFDIRIKTPDANQLADQSKITEIFKAVLCSYHDVEKLDSLDLNQITHTSLEYTPEEGAKVDGFKTTKKINDVFLKTFQSKNYYGTRLSGKKPTIADAIEDIYYIQTSATIAGPITAHLASDADSSSEVDADSSSEVDVDSSSEVDADSSSEVDADSSSEVDANSMNRPKKGLDERASSAIGSSVRIVENFLTERFEEEIKKPENIKHMKNIYNYVMEGTKVPDDSKKFYYDKILPYILREDEDRDRALIRYDWFLYSRLKEVFEMINENLSSNEKINTDGFGVFYSHHIKPGPTPIDMRFFLFSRFHMS